MKTQESIKENAMKYRAELLDAMNNFQREVNSYIFNGDEELNSWQGKMDTRFNELRASFRTLDAWWDSVVEVSESEHEPA